MSLDQLIPAEDALQIVLENVMPISSEAVGLAEAGNRILFEDLIAKRTQPPFDASAMDGYAVKQTDLGELPAELSLVGESRAGVPFGGQIEKDQAVRIFTGAVVPQGADSIVIQENTETSNDGKIRVLSGVPQGKFIRKAGLDFTKGETLLLKGQELTPARLALAASMNYAEIEVYRKPCVALLSTGDELVLPGNELKDGQIIASNTYGLLSSIQNSGGKPVNLGIVADTSDALKRAFTTALKTGANLIVTTGGASVGDHDLVLPAAAELGFEFEIAKIAMRPGKPFLFATLQYEGRTVYLTGLAGNPVSSIVAFNVFVKPLIQLLGGRSADMIARRPAILGKDLAANDERAEYMRATLTMSEDGQLIVVPFESQDSSMLANLVRAQCLVYRAVKAPAAKRGDRVEIVVIEGSNVS